MEITEHTVIKYCCKRCGIVESVVVGDLPKTPLGHFIQLPQLHCVMCSDVAVDEIEGQQHPDPASEGGPEEGRDG